MRHNQYDIPQPDSQTLILRHSLNVLPEDSKTREIRLPERPGASSFTRYFWLVKWQDYCNAKSEWN